MKHPTSESLLEQTAVGFMLWLGLLRLQDEEVSCDPQYAMATIDCAYEFVYGRFGDPED